MIESARYRASYFEKDGALRFRPAFPRASLRDRLRRASILRGRALDLATDFLKHCLTIDRQSDSPRPRPLFIPG